MITLNQTQKDLIESHTLACYPEEMCGILTLDSFISLPNTSKSPEKSFSINPKDLYPYLGQIIAIVHSHCRNPRYPEIIDTRTPSVADVRGQETSNLPWLIVCSEGETVTAPLEFPVEPSSNYIGRPFIWFINDCYSLVQDYYRFELDIILPKHKGMMEVRDLMHLDNLFDDFIAEYKFIESSSLENLQNGDLLLLDYNSKIRNHLGIYHNGKIIHQDLLSVEVPFETFVGRINKVLKYEGNSLK